MLRTTRVADLTRFGDLAEEKRVILGVPNTGRLLDEVASLTGSIVGEAGGRSLRFDTEDFIVVCARSNDLPYLAANGLADLVITGFDYVVEAGVDLVELHDTGYQRCSIGLLGPAESHDWRRHEEITVATQYPAIAERYFDQPGLPSCELLVVSGAAEFYARTGIVDLIVDAHMTGMTAAANGLSYLETILETSGRIFAKPNWTESPKNIEDVCRMLTR
ncbi:ATP phosphoribosyltransferase [Nonomuraea sp. SMC257]|uniref:ATP phosphoribosyltransferase n=1 Tax=Nonomuraea montanisoli TaxID=2741721 RepID=A0A7Y6I2J9_9ACTN|nr:ATP phosphoribosyltransferase [Nonomuraea montanisoli]NUW30538.1 ATP phosphoribosyltransferase [Nonomuraea montanisoli]